MKKAEYWIEKLEMTPHPEGGYFKEVYRSVESHKADHLPERYPGDRPHSTSIYFLLKDDQVSKFHRIKSDEIWHFYYGSPVTIFQITHKGELIKTLLGKDLENGETLQAVIPHSEWFGAMLNESELEQTTKSGSYCLVGCTVAPGFHFDDFELADREKLLKKYPQYPDLIKKLT